MKNVDVAPASILWLPDTPGTRRDIPVAEYGALKHPVLVLSNPDYKKDNSESGKVNIQILIVSLSLCPPICREAGAN